MSLITPNLRRGVALDLVALPLPPAILALDQNSLMVGPSDDRVDCMECRSYGRPADVQVLTPHLEIWNKTKEKALAWVTTTDPRV